MVRMACALTARPYVDVFSTFGEAAQAVSGNNPFFVETTTS